MRCLIICLVMLLLAAACGTNMPPRLTPAPAQPSLQALNCESIISILPVACAQSSPEMILQSALQVTMRYASLSLTFDSTLWLSLEDHLTIAPLDGVAIASIGGTSQVIRAGTWLTLDPLSGSPPGAPTAYDPAMISNNLLAALPNVVEMPPVLNPEATEEPRIVQPIPTRPGGCIPRRDWEAIYTVRSGDSYARIAERHDTTLAELLAANCFSGSETLQPGDTMRVPKNVTAGVPPVPARFYSDRVSIPPGECTMLFWQAQEVRRAFINSEQVDAEGSMEVCPGQTTQYTLRVQYNNGVEATYTLTVSVVLELSQ